MSAPRRRAARLAAVAVVAALVAGCGASSVRGFLDDTYALVSQTGDAATYTATTPVSATAAAIAAQEAPPARATADGAEYLRYDQDIVVVRPAAAGSTVLVEDLDGPFRNGAYAFLGPGFTPGSVVEDDGGPGDAK